MTSQHRFKRGILTCPVCLQKHRYNCSVATDGNLVICKNVTSDRAAKDGRYLHFLDADGASHHPPPPNVAQPAQRADADASDATLTALLRRLHLRPEHADELLSRRRGLSDNFIAHNLYASTPDDFDAGRVACDLANEGYRLTGIPGFYCEPKTLEWRINNYPKFAGFYVPCRDARGRIVGCQIKLDAPLGKAKYVWLSSAQGWMMNGTPQTARLHFVKPDLIKDSRRAVITEGFLKADIIGEELNACVIGIAGVGSFPRDIGFQLRRALPELREVSIAFDADAATNENVAREMQRLQSALAKAGLRVRVMRWQADTGKGFDDYLLAARFAASGAQEGGAYAQ